MKIFKLSTVKFSPSLTMVFLTLVVVSLLSALGWWQICRAHQKREILNHYAFMQQQAARNILEPTLAIENFQKIKVTGIYDNQHQFLIDNQYYNHAVGYQILTPLLLNNGMIVLVNRGWIAADPNRAVLPALNPIIGKQTVIGSVYYNSPKTWTLGKTVDSPAGTWPLRIEKIDLPQTSALLGKKVYPFTLRLEPSQPFGFVRDWKVVIMLPSRHIAYAVQWLVMALIVIIIFLRLNFEYKDYEAN